MTHKITHKLRAFAAATVIAAAMMPAAPSAHGFRIRPGSSLRFEAQSGQIAHRVSSDDYRLVTFTTDDKGWTVAIVNAGKTDLSFSVPAPHTEMPAMFTLSTASGYKSFYLSQHIFNDDDKYEVIFGQEVYNQDGVHLGHIPSLSATEYEGGLLLGNSTVITDATPDDVSLDLLNAMFDQAKDINRINGSYFGHFDFGLPAVMLALDTRSAEISREWYANAAYDWFNNYTNLSLNPKYAITQYLTLIPEQHVASANNVLADVGTRQGPIADFITAQALAWRAYNNFLLVQMRQFTYAGHEDLPGIPLVTESNRYSLRSTGVAPSTVREVYDAILDDLRRADTLLDDAADPSTVMPDRPKSAISKATVLGLLARVYLVMQQWDKAADCASRAIELSGCTPLSPDEALTDDFSHIDSHSWLWGIQVSEDEQAAISGLMNFQSHMAFSSHCYYNLVPRKIHYSLARTIEPSDVRASWFFDENGYSRRISTDKRNEILNTISQQGCRSLKDVSLKFSHQTLDTVRLDFPLMRIEEMHLIAAEAKLRQGNTAEAAAVLTDFVSSCRNPQYTAPSDPDELAAEISRQRRIELWGEGFSWFDIMRADKGFSGKGAGLPKEVSCYEADKDDPALPVPLSMAALGSNKAFTEADIIEFVQKTPVNDTTVYEFPYSRLTSDPSEGFEFFTEAMYNHNSVILQGSETADIFLAAIPRTGYNATIEIRNSFFAYVVNILASDQRYICHIEPAETEFTASDYSLMVTDRDTYIATEEGGARNPDNAGFYDPSDGTLYLPLIFYAPGVGCVNSDLTYDTVCIPELLNILTQ